MLPMLPPLAIALDADGARVTFVADGTRGKLPVELARVKLPLHPVRLIT